MSKTDIKNNKNDSLFSQNINKTISTTNQISQSLIVKNKQNIEEMICLNKTDENIINEQNSSVNIYNSNKNSSTKEIVYNLKELNDKNILKSNKNTKTKKIKKENTARKKKKQVKFMEPQFVEIILVESYKKFNEENTSKDPFDKDENENKTKLMCSCFIY